MYLFYSAATPHLMAPANITLSNTLAKWSEFLTTNQEVTGLIPGISTILNVD